jgi:hypothetical protein
MLKISKMSGKLEGLKALNTSPNQNEFCQRMQQNNQAVCSECFSQRMIDGYRKNCEPAWLNNGDILSQCILPDVTLPMINAAYFRYSAHGELINDNHFINLIHIAQRNPHCTFGLWTKRRDIVNRVLGEMSLPDNLIMIFSEPRINAKPRPAPAHFHKTFTVITDDNPTPVNCGIKQCLSCLNCYSKDGPEIIVERLQSAGGYRKD